jgi:hypothetical protein
LFLTHPAWFSGVCFFINPPPPPPPPSPLCCMRQQQGASFSAGHNTVSVLYFDIVFSLAHRRQKIQPVLMIYRLKLAPTAFLTDGTIYSSLSAPSSTLSQQAIPSHASHAFQSCTRWRHANAGTLCAFAVFSSESRSRPGSHQPRIVEHAPVSRDAQWSGCSARGKCESAQLRNAGIGTWRLSRCIAQNDHSARIYTHDALGTRQFAERSSRAVACTVACGG